MSLTLVRAAAGCGKTTELARRYLGFVAAGIPVERAIAITFTRRAAAELVERVTLALRATLDGPIAERARAELGSAWPLYRELAPTDPELSRRALAGLPSAPIGTTDRFVHALLTEHALYAAVPLPNGEAVPIDVPITPTTGLYRHLERAARRVLDPPEGGVDPDVALLSRYFGLDEILGWLAQAEPYDALPVARTQDVMGFVAGHLAELLTRHDVAATWQISDLRDLGTVREALQKSTNQSGSWAVEAVAQWIAAGMPDPAPFELAGWLNGLQTRSGARKAVQNDLMKTWIDLGPAKLSLHQVVDTMRYPYDDRSHVELADRLQGARERLRQQVVAIGLDAAARSGELDHSSLTAAAIALCADPPPRLRNRYAALLVDEVQDASPEQLALYRALASLPADPPIQTVMVGDVRQSIYLFRGAEPAGFAQLVQEADDSARVALGRNFRSHAALVGAHRTMFAALEAPMRAAGYQPIDALTELEHDPANDDRALDPTHHDPPQPVWLIVPEDGEEVDYRGIDTRAVHAFSKRLEAAWSEPGHERDSAVVLTPSWSAARQACRQIRAWTGRDDSAFVDGGGAWLSGPVGSDLRMILRALLDPTDDLAWLALWKHPMVGLTDGALARIRGGTGMVVLTDRGSEPAPSWAVGLGRVLVADALVPPHDPVDVEAFARARGPLIEAREAIGRRDLAGVLDRLAHALEWRVILAAGPGADDDVAALEVALDLVRELEAESAAPDAILGAFQDADSTELPRVQLERPARSISCTTTFQAKGLAWDHVCVVAPGRAGRVHDAEPAVTSWVELGGIPHRIVGLKFDPTGALSPFKDPVGRLGVRIGGFRHEEECARLVYVAITRARRSVTLGLPTRTGYLTGLQGLCASTWSTPELAGDGIAHVCWPEPPPAARAPTGWVALASQIEPAPPAPAGRSWTVRQPSSYASHHDVATRLQDAQRFEALVRLGRGLTIGSAPIEPPIEAHPGIRPWEWGELAHGWLAHWQFSGTARERAARSWLADAWGLDAADVAHWLVALSENLPSVGGPLWELVTAPKARLWFEHPFVGVAGRQDDVVLSGRIDLLVKHGRTVSVIDFKAGGKSPTGWGDLIEQGGLKTYGPQLEAYNAALRTAGLQVDRVGLWFVRTGTQVVWSQ